jgi:hypothetical protein
VNQVEKGRGERRAGSKALVVAAGFLAIPVVALLWVDSYAKMEPRLAGFPFFIWYQFLWVFLCAICTWAAYSIVRMARPRRSLTPSSQRGREKRR